MGYLAKRGAIMKNWKKRYFVVNPDYSVDYFENEEVCHSLFYFDSQYTFVMRLVLIVMWTHFSLNKQAYGKGFKPKGTIFPCGYEVFANMEETMMERIKNLAKLLGK